jgi:DNA-binding XRE family transcriptional regulator
MAEDIKKEIQEENLVKKTCRELGITQKELAERIGVSKQTIYDWSSGKTPIPSWGFNFMIMIKEIPNLLILKDTIDKIYGGRNTGSLTI